MSSNWERVISESVLIAKPISKEKKTFLPSSMTASGSSGDIGTGVDVGIELCPGSGTVSGTGTDTGTGYIL